MSELSKYQKFVMERIDRRTIKNAPYNPRKISEAARKKLTSNLKEVGLLGPVTVNKKTGNVVGGHQRLAALDALEGSDNYLLDVAMVSLTPKREKEQNLFLNNQGAQGEWDLDALAAMLPEIGIEHTGFDKIELEMMFSGTDYESFFSDAGQPESVQQTQSELAAIVAERAPGEKSKAAEIMAKARALGKSKDADSQTNNFACVVFPNVADRENFVERLGYSRDEIYISGERVIGNLKQA